MTAAVWSVDPRTDERREQVTTEDDSRDVDRAVRAAHAARQGLADRATRVTLLRAAAEELEAVGDEIITAADAETALGTTQLTGELGRTTRQLRTFADEVADGAFLDVAIDHGAPEAAVPRPDLRRYKLPLGVVAVYAASNFPMAFSVPGGDTASALAAGCPVVVKAHPGHPATSDLCARALRRATVRAGLPEGTVGVVHGFDAGVELIGHPLVAAAGFTGSVRGGRALFDAAAARPEPIPFHGELGSLNPVVLTDDAVRERGEAIAEGLAAAMTAGTGQFCVKPGLVLVPGGESGDALVASLVRHLEGGPAQGVLLGARIRRAFLDGVRERQALPGVRTALAPGEGDGNAVRAGVLTVDAATLHEPTHEPLLEECFGPVTVLARYSSWQEVGAVLDSLRGNLTATVHLGEKETAGDGEGAALLERLTLIAGRLVVNGWPVGVAVVPAQHHGGPYPATTSTATSVGATAVERWLRPVVYQNTPEALLPPELHDANPLGLPRRINGHREG